MTPAARIAAAIGLLDRWLGGEPLEKALTTWGRENRYAGSGDRAAIRDHVFDAVRRRRSYAALGGAISGRGLMLGSLRASGQDAAAVFTGAGHAPEPLTAEEAAHPIPGMSEAEALDCPDWLLPRFQDSLGADTAPVLQALRDRAPVFLRANLLRATRDDVIAALAPEGIAARPHPLARTAIEVTEGARRIQSSVTFTSGLAELQDAASQAVVEMLPLGDGQRVLDYCAGGGGKSLAMAARAAISVDAHDADPARMRDLPARAARAGANIRPMTTAAVRRAAPYDLVLLDVPCSGSGSWRRSPEAKWNLTSERLTELLKIQAQILDTASEMVAPAGWLAYATCSLLQEENAAQIAAFRDRHEGWEVLAERRFTPLDGGDGFYCAVLRRTGIQS
ncbi:RsmB/NOP family class I SAM-dependent RNA methyltransferase [Halodurantibacterium flavum]|uniref:RsmB/NOP family class I SAM-dependent RNA methyltransferase n=1 Tax=Halodurantibacterium flavum TaxID=1382802 RepID=A0ABW4S437_9RHOB